MKDNHDLIKIWQEASKKIEETNKLTRSIIVKSIESKSQDVMSQFIREKKAGLISGIILIPVIIFGFFASFSVNIWSIVFAIILSTAWIYGIIDGLKQLKTLKSLDQTGSLSDNLSAKLKYLSKQLSRAKFLSPILGVGIYLPLILIYRYLEYGNLILEKDDKIVFGVSIVVIVLITSLMTRFQKSKYISPLRECLEELQNLEPPKLNTHPRVNLAVILAIVLAISMVVYWIVSR